MSFKKNVITNYASQFYVAGVGIFIVPLYIRIMGAEAYGLVAFFTLLQSCFLLLDVGLTPTVSREAARYRGGATNAIDLLKFIRALEGFFWALGFTAAFVIWLCADAISREWLQSTQISRIEVKHAVEVMGMIAGLRWVSGLYRGVITGFERITWLAGFNSCIATLRFLLVIPLLIYVSATPQSFFSFQMTVALVELSILMVMTRTIMPHARQRVPWHWGPIAKSLGFSSTLAVTNLIWLTTTQLDKFLLSKALPLAEYGFFAMAVLVASGVTIIGTPISSAVLPRLAHRAASNDNNGLNETYRQSTQIVAATVIPIAGLMVAYAEPLIWMWTNDRELSVRAAPIVSLYAAGNALMTLAAFAYYLQYAHGKLRLHLLGNVLFISVLIPSLWFATSHYGAIGAGWVWLISNATYFMMWVPLIHHRLAPGLHLTWLINDIGRSAASTTAVIAITKLINWPDDRLLVLAIFSALAILLLTINALAQPLARGKITNIILKPGRAQK